MIMLVVTCGDCRFVDDKLLSVNFFGNVFWIGENVVIFVYDAI